MDQLKGFGQVYALTILQHLFASYRVIYEINLKENAVKMMTPYERTEPLSRLIEQLEKRREFERAECKTISDSIMMSKVITLLEKMGIFNDDIIE